MYVRGVQRTGMQVADAKALFIFEKHIELAAITGEARLGIEQRAKDFLHLGNVRTDGGMAAELAFEVSRRREVVGVHVGFQHPLHGGLELCHTIDQAIRRSGAGAPGLGVVVQHAVDQCALKGFTIHDQIADGRGRLVVEGVHVKVVADDHHVLQIVCSGLYGRRQWEEAYQDACQALLRTWANEHGPLITAVRSGGSTFGSRLSANGSVWQSLLPCARLSNRCRHA